MKNGFLSLVMVCVAFGVLGCSPASGGSPKDPSSSPDGGADAATAAAVSQAVGVGLNVASSICTALDLQDEPEWVKLSCETIDTVNSVKKIFFARVPRKPLMASCVRAPQK